MGLKYFEFAISNAGLISEEIISGGTELTSPEETLDSLAPEAKIDIRALTVPVADRTLSHGESEFELGVAASDSRFDISAFPTAPEALAEVPIASGIDLTPSVSDTLAPRIETEPEPGITLSRLGMNAPFHISNSGEDRVATETDFVEPMILLLPTRNYHLLEIWEPGTNRIPDISTAYKDSIRSRYKHKTCCHNANGYGHVRFWDPGELS